MYHKIRCVVRNWCKGCDWKEH